MPASLQGPGETLQAHGRHPSAHARRARPPTPRAPRRPRCPRAWTAGNPGAARAAPAAAPCRPAPPPTSGAGGRAAPRRASSPSRRPPSPPARRGARHRVWGDDRPTRPDACKHAAATGRKERGIDGRRRGDVSPVAVPPVGGPQTHQVACRVETLVLVVADGRRGAVFVAASVCELGSGVRGQKPRRPGKATRLYRTAQPTEGLENPPLCPAATMSAVASPRAQQGPTPPATTRLSSASMSRKTRCIFAVLRAARSAGSLAVPRGFSACAPPRGGPTRKHAPSLDSG